MSQIDLNLEGENLYRQFLSAIAGQNWSAVEAMISPSFQSAHSDGARDHVAELALLKGIDLGTYTLHDFKVTKADSHLVVTCMISIEKTDLKPDDIEKVYQELKKYKYDFLNFNCEHFVNFAKDKNYVSPQVLRWTTVALIGLGVYFLLKNKRI
jgi:hypothetical protein